MTEAFDPKTGKPVRVPEGQMRERFLRGEIAFRKGQAVPLVDPDGKVYTVDSSELATTLEQRPDLGLASGAAMHRAEAEEKYDNAAIAGAAGVARGATLGASDWIAGEIGGDQAREALSTYERTSPIASGVGEVGGALAPLLLSGGAAGAAEAGVEGAGALSRGARALLAATPARGVGLVGDAAAALAERGVAAAGLGEGSALGRAAGRIVPGAVRGAAEGALYGGGQGLSEAALGDPDRVGEHVLAGIGHGALIGGGLGAAGGAVETLFGEAGRGVRGLLAPRAADVESVATKAGMDAATGLGDKFIEASSFLSGHTPEEIRHFFGSAEAKANRAAARFGVDREGAVRSITADADELIQALNDVSEETRGALKLDQVQKSVTRGNERAVEDAAMGVLGEMQARVNGMLADPGAYGFQANLKKTSQIVDSAFNRVLKIAEEGGEHANARIFMELDGVKRALGPFAKPGVDLRMLPSLDQATAHAMDEMYHQIRAGLESESLFGKAAEMQRLDNAAMTKFLGANEMMRPMTRKIGRDEANAFRPKFGADPAAWDRHLGQLGAARNSTNEKMVDEWLASVRGMAERARDSDLGGRITELADRLEKRLGTEGAALKENNLLRSMMGEESSGISAHTDVVAGWLAGGPVGALAGAGFAALAKPGKSLWHLASIERATAAVQTRSRALVASAVKSIGDTASRAARATEAGAVSAATRWARATENPRVFDRKVDAIRTFASSPEVQMDRTQKALGDDVWTHAPAVASAVVSTSARGAAFLASKIPPTRMATGLTPQLERPSVPPSERLRFSRYAAAVEEPLSVLEDLVHGRLSLEGVEALRVVYPRIYQDASAQIIERLTELREPLPYDARLQIGLFLGAQDTTTAPGFIAAIQATYATSPGGPSGDGGPPPAAPRHMLKVQSSGWTATQQVERQ